MTDNTRVIELQNKLLQAMDIINSRALNSISYDKTIVCTIEQNDKKESGEYQVNSGSSVFTAYSTFTNFTLGTQVYVTIPNGDYNNQKIIIGKKTSQTEQPFIFTMPFDDIFDMTDNILNGVEQQAGTGALIANSLPHYSLTNAACKKEQLMYSMSNLSISNYTRLGLRADFKSWIKNAFSGDYGLLVVLTAKSQTVVSQGEDVTPETKDYSFILNSSDMYGNPYAFETDYSQEIVIPLEQVNGIITDIKIYFYQDANFQDSFKEPLPCSEKGYKTNTHNGTYEKDADGNYVLNNDDNLLLPNLFVSNLYLCFGYAMSIFNKDYVELYTQDKITFKPSTEEGEDNKLLNQKLLKIRWVHLKDKRPIDILHNPIEDLKYEIRWYKYVVGAPSADAYCGVYWERIKDVNGFEYVFNPNVAEAQEKIKVVIICENMPYYSNELLFTNETKDLPISQEAQRVLTALVINTDDETNGNYLVYGQDNSIKDTVYGKETRTLSCVFDADGDGVWESSPTFDNLVWVFPTDNTMIELLNGDLTQEKDEYGNYIRSNIVTGEQPQYKIKNYFSPKNSNNTITCQYYLNGIVYSTEKEFTFGKAGTMGSAETLIIDFLDDQNAVTTTDKLVRLQVQLYDQQNRLQTIPDETVKWSWFYNSAIKSEAYNITDKGNAILDINSSFTLDNLYIIQATVGKLTTYFPIPVRSHSDYGFIEGPTQVIYGSSGEPDFVRIPYQLYLSGSEQPFTNVTWNIKTSEAINKYAYVGRVSSTDFMKQDHYTKTTDDKYTKATSYSSSAYYYVLIKNAYCGTINEENELVPLSIYVEEAPVYGVQALAAGITPVWTQPILTLKNLWGSNVINEWDGKSLQIDEEKSSILAASLAAGRKDSQNRFSGVMIGDWGNTNTEGAIKKQTGVYGFHQGAMSYALKDDGTAFFGKDGRGRIHIDGNEATLTSALWVSKTSGTGMEIDLDRPSIYLRGKDNTNTAHTILIDASVKKEPFKIGDNFVVEWDGTMTAYDGNFSGTLEASGGTIGLWTIDNDGQIVSKNGNIVLNAENNGSITLGNGLSDSYRILLSAGYRHATTKEYIPTIIEMGSNSIIKGGILSPADGDMALRGSLTAQVQNSSNAWVDGGKIGFLTADYGGEAEDDDAETKKHAGIGMSYGEVSVVKATNSNAGLSCGGYYLSLQNRNSPSGDCRATLRSTNSDEGRLILDASHIGIGFGASSDPKKENKGSYISLQRNSSGADEIVIYADKIIFNTGADAETAAKNQSGIYARFA